MLADSHIHLFENGHKNSGDNEIALYESLINEYSISDALVVGYEGEVWAAGNNAYIAALAKTRPWLHPLAFVRPEQLQIAHLQKLLLLGFEGITLYLFTDTEEASLLAVDVRVWKWLDEHEWIISVNSKGVRWSAWLQVLSSVPTLMLVISHLGSPTVNQNNLALEDIKAELAVIKSICGNENVYLKLSGFYAFEPTTPVYPYPNVVPFIKYIMDNFAIDRLIWGSDFTPALASVEFPQTFQHFSELPFFKSQDLSKILSQNLLNLLSSKTKSEKSERG